MNIDFHYGVIYLVSRLSNLSPADAATVAHACQYVDDSTTPGILKFQDGQEYTRIASAHEMIDHNNLCIDSTNIENKHVWVPFHFLPGNKGESFEDRMVCHIDSPIARSMVKQALQNRSDNSLHRLGVALHVYIDTWAHQRFVGICSDLNVVTNLREGYQEGEPHQGWLEEIKMQGYNLQAALIGELTHLGHGMALSFPDMPWQKWLYVNGKKEVITRDNPTDFTQAAHMATKVIQAFKANRLDFENLPGLTEDQQDTLHEKLSGNIDDDPQNRLKAISDNNWLGAFGLQETIPDYVAKGINSWKYQATGLQGDDDSGDIPDWSNFENSDYRKFHDALKQHYSDVTGILLENQLLNSA